MTLALGLGLLASAAFAQGNPRAPGQPAANAPQPAASWRSQCVSAGRHAEVSCIVEKSAVQAGTGQLVADASIRFLPNGKPPLMALHVPLGIYVPAGIGFQIDGSKTETLPIESCDARGCFGSIDLPARRLQALKSGKVLRIEFHALNRRVVAIAFDLNGFADAVDRAR